MIIIEVLTSNQLSGSHSLPPGTLAVPWERLMRALLQTSRALRHNSINVVNKRLPKVAAANISCFLTVCAWLRYWRSRFGLRWFGHEELSDLAYNFSFRTLRAR